MSFKQYEFTTCACFSQIFGPEVGQADVFDGTVRSQVMDFLLGKNSLLFSYGVTNAGKTHTIQGKIEQHDAYCKTIILDISFMLPKWWNQLYAGVGLYKVK